MQNHKAKQHHATEERQRKKGKERHKEKARLTWARQTGEETQKNAQPTNTLIVRQERKEESKRHP
jgi:hypothetical protein